MANNNDEKLISGLTARKYLNCNKAEFENLVEQGIIQAYRDDDYEEDYDDGYGY